MTELTDKVRDFDYQALLHDFIIPWATNIIFALLIFFIGRMIKNWVVKLTRAALKRGKLEPMLINFVVSILSWALLLVVLVAALDQLGVDTTSLIALLGAAGIAVGLALKDSLQNFAAGVMLLVFKPFREGDFIEAAGIKGVVEEIRIFYTLMHTPENIEMTVPNGDIFNGVITNYSAKDTRRIDLVIGIGYDDDIQKAKDILTRLVTEDERVLKDPEPFIAVGELGASSVDLLVRPWTKSSDFWATKCDLTERIKLAFDAEGVSIPYPQTDVHLDGKLKTPESPTDEKAKAA